MSDETTGDDVTTDEGAFERIGHVDEVAAVGPL